MDKPHILTIAIEDDGRFYVDYIFKGNRNMGYYLFSDLFTQIRHETIVEAALDIAGIPQHLSLKEKIAMFNLIGARR